MTEAIRDSDIGFVLSTMRMEMRHLHASRTPVETGACILHGNWKRAEYFTRWSLMSILEENNEE